MDYAHMIAIELVSYWDTHDKIRREIESFWATYAHNSNVLTHYRLADVIMIDRY